MEKIKVNSRKTGKQKLATIIVVLIVIIMILGLMIIYLSPESSERRYDYEVLGVHKPENYVEPEEVTKSLKFENIEVFQSFSGTMPVSTGRQIIKDMLILQIPRYLDLTKDFTDEQISNFFEQNSVQIRGALHVNTEKEFRNMLDKFRSLKSEINEYTIEKCELSQDASIKLKIVFTNKETVECKMLGGNIHTFYLEF